MKKHELLGLNVVKILPSPVFVPAEDRHMLPFIFPPAKLRVGPVLHVHPSWYMRNGSSTPTQRRSVFIRRMEQSALLLSELNEYHSEKADTQHHNNSKNFFYKCNNSLFCVWKPCHLDPSHLFE